MKRHVIKSIAIMLTVVLLTSFVFPFGVYAEENTPTVTPRWSIIAVMDMNIGFFAEGDGVVSAAVTGQSNVTLLEGRLRLFEYVNDQWVLLDDYTKTSTYASLGMEVEFYAVPGRDYKAYFYVTAHSGDDKERAYCKVEDTCPNP